MLNLEFSFKGAPFKPSHEQVRDICALRDERRDGALTQAAGKPVVKVGLFIIEAVIDPALCPSKDLMWVTNTRALVTL
jgi:hypothetical protein